MGKDMFSYEADVKKYNKTLRKLSSSAIPRAIAATLNRQAEATSAQALTNLKKKLIVRTPFTTKSLRVSKSRPKPDIGAMYSKAGTISPYLPIQETGGTIPAREKVHAVPTLQARVGKRKAGRISSAQKMSKIGSQVGRPGSKFFFMSSRGGKKGIFYRKSKKKIVKVRDISKRFIRIKPTYWFSEAVKKFHNRRFLEKVYCMEAKKEIARIKGVKR